MMNNSWYRVKLEVSPPVSSAGSRSVRSRMSQSGTERALQYMMLLQHEHGGEMVLQRRDAVVEEERQHQRKSTFATEKFPSVGCYHPLMPTQNGGWLMLNHQGPLHTHMRRGPLAGTGRALKLIPADELEKHKGECWVVIDGMVCDLSNYMNDHPGGKHTLLAHAGNDVTDIFYDIHGDDAVDIKDRFAIGVLAHSRSLRSPFEITKLSGSSIRPDIWQEVELTETVRESHDTIRLHLRFADSRKVGIPVGQHLLVGADIDGEFVVRPYTPIAPVDLRNPCETIELLVKVYKPQGKRPGGKMSMFMDKMKPGNKLKVKGPAGHIVYLGNGSVVVHSSTVQLNQMCFIAGGTGITPVYQFVKHILDDPNDNTELALLYSNSTPDDILMKKELDELAAKNPGKFHLWYTITRQTDSSKEWKYGVGRVNGNMISETLLAPTPRSGAFVVGPPPMIEQACLPYLHRMGYTEENLFEF